MGILGLFHGATCHEDVEFVESATCHINMLRKTFPYKALRKTLKFI